MDDAAAAPVSRPRLFLSYGRRDAADIAGRLTADLQRAGYDVWQDTRQIHAGREWDEEIRDGLRSTQVVIALLSPHAVRTRAASRDGLDSVCLDEISFATFSRIPVVPAMAVPCEPPFCLFRLDYVDLAAWQESEARYQAGLERLLDGIAAALRGETRYRSWTHWLQPLDFAPYLDEKRRHFCGRGWLMQEIDAWRVSSRERALLVTGDPGSGKSALVAQLVHLNPDGQVLAYHCCQADTPVTLQAGKFVQSLAAMIASRLETYAVQLETDTVRRLLADESCLRDPASAFERGIVEPLHRLHAPAEGVRLVLIDALDEALTLPPALNESGTTIVDLLATRLARLPAWLKVVATTRREPDVLDRLGALRARSLDAQDARTLDDIDAYVAVRLATPDLAARLTGSGLTVRDVQARLREAGSGNFLYVKEALDQLERGDLAFDRLDELPRGLTGLYHAFFTRIVGARPDAASYGPTRTVLEVVVAAREPIGLDLLAEATGLDAEYDLPALLRPLEAFLPVRDDRCAVFHTSLTDWLTQPRHVFRASAARGHERLADACRRDLDRGADRMSPYTARHLAGHLLAATRWDALEALFTSLAFVEAKAARGEVFQLARDLKQTALALPPDRPARRLFTLLEEALQRHALFINRHARDYPQALFQSLWNSAWWYDCPEAAAHYLEPEEGWQTPPPWTRSDATLHVLLERWRAEKDAATPRQPWLRSLRPPPLPLGTPQLAVLRGHEGRVTAVDCSPDGTRIITGGDDGTVRVWDAARGTELDTLVGHDEAVEAVSCAPDGSRVASASADGTIRIWNLTQAREVAVLRGHDDGVSCVRYAPDGTSIASGSRDGTVRVWNVGTGAQRLALTGHTGAVVDVGWSPDSSRIVSAGGDEVRIWSADGAPVSTVRERDVTAARYMADGSRIVSQCSRGYLVTRDASTWAVLDSLRHRGHQRMARYWTDGVHAFGASKGSSFGGQGDAPGHTLLVWTADGTPVTGLYGHTDRIRSAVCSPDRTRCISTSDDGTARVWDTTTVHQIAALRGHARDINRVVALPDGLRSASGSDDGTIRVWDATTGREIAVLRGHTGSVQVVACLPDGRLVSGSADTDGDSPDGSIRIWDLKTGSQRIEIAQAGGVTLLDCSPDGSRVASVTADTRVRVLDVADGVERLVLPHETSLSCLRFSPDGVRIATGSRDGTIHVWDAATGVLETVLQEPPRLVRGHTLVPTVYSVAWSPDGTRLLTAAGPVARVWDVATGEPIVTLPEHEFNLLGAAYSSDGSRLITVDLPPTDVTTIRLWNADTGTCLETIAVGVGGENMQELVDGPPAFPWRALFRGGDTIVEQATTGQPVAWLPDWFPHLVTHVDGRTWTAAASSDISIVTLENAPPSRPKA